MRPDARYQTIDDRRRTADRHMTPDTRHPTVQSPAAPPQPKSPRSLFWIAFAIGFVLLALASCGGVAMLVGLDNISLADLQSSGPVWTPPPAPTPLPADATRPSGSAQPGLPADRLQAGGPARNVTNSRVNIRRIPGYLGKGDDDILGRMEPGASVTILDGPQTADQLVWWYIRYAGPGGNVEGWVAESTASGVQILAPE